MNPMRDAGSLALANRLKRLSDGLLQDGIRLYRAAGVDFEPRWFGVYFYLCRSRPAPVTEIARDLGVSHPAINQVAREMISANLIAAYRDTRDKRKRVLALTSHGKAQRPGLERLWGGLASAMDELLGEGGDEFLAAVTRLEQALADKSLQRRFLERYERQPST